MSRDRSPNPRRMRFTCDPCGVVALAVPLGEVPRGWRCEPTRDTCHLWGATPEEQLVRYLEADLGLEGLVQVARDRVAARSTSGATRDQAMCSAAGCRRWVDVGPGGGCKVHPDAGVFVRGCEPT